MQYKRVKLVLMEMVRAHMDLGPDYFRDEYPGSFLLPIGLLAGAVGRPPPKPPPPRPRKTPPPLPGTARQRVGRMTEAVPILDPDETTAVTDFGARMRHSREEHPLAGKLFFIRHMRAAPSLVIGRGKSCDLVIPEASVSDRHCEIMLDEKGGLTGVDLVSKNGTSVNLERVKPGMPMIIADEDILSFGRYSFQFFHAMSLYNALQVLYSVR